MAAIRSSVRRILAAESISDWLSLRRSSASALF
jgi:hypothetical protein